MEKKFNNAYFKLALGKKKIKVYNYKTNELVDEIYFDEKIDNQYLFNAECASWYADNYDVVED